MASQLQKLLRLRAVCDATALCRSSIYQLERDGLFPKRVAIGPRSVAWREEEIRIWIDARQRKVAA